MAEILQMPVDIGPADPPRRFSSPLARRLAREAGIPLDEVTGTGPRGRIRRRDIDAAVAERTAKKVQARPSLVSGRASDAAFDEVAPSHMRRAIASRMTVSKQTVPHFYLRASCRVDALLALRAGINEDAAQKVSVGDLVVKAVGRAHQLVPDMNVSWTDGALLRYRHVDVGVTIATDDGLVTPVVRSVEATGLSDVAATVEDYANRARAQRLEQHELEGGSITVTNLGMFGVEEFSAIINPPQSAVLAVGVVRREPVAAGDRVELASVMKLVLSVDHRPIDGATAGRWMSQFTGLLERPVRILS